MQAWRGLLMVLCYASLAASQRAKEARTLRGISYQRLFPARAARPKAVSRANLYRRHRNVNKVVAAHPVLPCATTALVPPAAAVVDRDVGQVAHAHHLEHFLGVLVDGDALGRQLRHVRHEVEAALALLLLQLEADAAHRAALDALHEVRQVPAILLRMRLLGMMATS